MSHSEYLEQLGPLVRQRRRELGLSQRRLARQLEMNAAHLCNIERSQQTVTVTTALKLTRWLEGVE